MTISHNITLNQSIVYRVDQPPVLVSRQEADKMVKEWTPQYEEEICLQTVYNKVFDGDWWPLSQEELIEKWNHRYDWMKNIRLVWST